MDYLLVDVSNSYTKIAFATREKVARSIRVGTPGLNAATFRKLLRGRQVGRVIVSSVVPARNARIRRAVAPVPTLFLTHLLDLGVGIDYPRPRSIGADRLANAAAVAELYGVPAIVVDFGTAVTFDVVSRRRMYVGGVIAPGLEAMTNFLYQRTALLPKVTLHEPKTAIGKTTRGAMVAGAVFGYRGLVREILERITREGLARSSPRVVATGGYARLIAAHLPEIAAVQDNLTLEGLRIIANRNPQGPA